MSPRIDIDERCLTAADVAERLSVNRDTVRRLFMNKSAVIEIATPRKGRRAYRTLRSPVTVYARVVSG